MKKSKKKINERDARLIQGAVKAMRRGDGLLGQISENARELFDALEAWHRAKRNLVLESEGLARWTVAQFIYLGAVEELFEVCERVFVNPVDFPSEEQLAKAKRRPRKWKSDKT